MALLARLAALFRKREFDSRIDDEMLFHLEMQIEENIRRGMSPQEARRQARIAGGGLEQAKELHRDARGIPFIESPCKIFATPPGVCASRPASLWLLSRLWR